MEIGVVTLAETTARPSTAAVPPIAVDQHGSVAGSPQEVVEKALPQRTAPGAQRFVVHVPVGTLPHAEVVRAVGPLGAGVAPAVRAAVAVAAVTA